VIDYGVLFVPDLADMPTLAFEVRMKKQVAASHVSPAALGET